MTRGAFQLVCPELRAEFLSSTTSRMFAVGSSEGPRQSAPPSASASGPWAPCPSVLAGVSRVPGVPSVLQELFRQRGRPSPGPPAPTAFVEKNLDHVISGTAQCCEENKARGMFEGQGEGQRLRGSVVGRQREGREGVS